MTQIEEFARVFQLPPAMLPYIDFVAEERERELVLLLANQPMSAPQVAEAMGMSGAEAEDFLKRAYFRDVVSRDTSSGTALYMAATFYARLDSLAMYERWGDVPAEARDEVIRWQLQEYIDKWMPALESIRRDPDVWVRVPNKDVLLLEEALEMVRGADDWAVTHCDCRAIVMGCNRGPEMCIRLGDGARRTVEHGQGRRITRDEMIEVVRESDREGLIHTGDRFWRESGRLFGFCNCCSCDCYPIRAGIALGMPREYPRAWYVAVRDEDACRLCGTCVDRCYFNAFHYVGNAEFVNGRVRQEIGFDPERCWGCGLCSTACPESAITMEPLRAVAG